MKGTIDKVAGGGANAILLHKGLVQAGHRGYGKDIGLIIHLSASTALGPDPDNKVTVTTVEEAVSLSADAVSVHVNIGAENEEEQLQELGRIAEVCESWGMPLLAVMYPRGEKIENEFDAEDLAHAARAGAELGADIVKTSFTEKISYFRKVTRGCPVPVLIGGGPKVGSDFEILEMASKAIRTGGAGVSIGRNVFQHKNPAGMVKALSKIVHQQTHPEEAEEEL